MRLDWSGSSLLSNCSFSSCITNDAPEPIQEPIPEDGKSIDLYQDADGPFSFPKIPFNTTRLNQVWILSCTFFDLYSGDGAAIDLDGYLADIVIKDSSFIQCRCHRYSGGAIFASHAKYYPSYRFYFTLFGCRFSNNTALAGGHLYVQNYSSLTVAQCTFANSRSGSSVPLNQKDPISILVHTSARFDNCTISNNEGSYTGGIDITTIPTTKSLILTDVLFKENVCTDTNISEQVTDCYFYNAPVMEHFEFFDCFSTSGRF
ncbi:hypothetical protein BLNAU_2076 [Blattamonas nauphoetae]|uniref:Right handed beta helix domain-containing protein n=1 Tax=Blattamonas nauphoetae TaxID=2049346 RepID=A0ABQ9YH54_9EUKA|nr:hypothetical protein BLNAU_2076 [Blattamonas nauphoetae]